MHTKCSCLLGGLAHFRGGVANYNIEKINRLPFTYLDYAAVGSGQWDCDRLVAGCEPRAVKGEKCAAP